MRLSALAVLLVVVTAGCGSDALGGGQPPQSRSAYEARTTAIDARLRQAYARAAVVVETARRPAQVADGYDGWSAAFSEAVDQLEHVTAPSEVQLDQQRLVEGLRGLASALRLAAARVRSGKAYAAGRIIDRLPYSTSASLVRDAAAAMRRRGYAVFVP